MKSHICSVCAIGRLKGLILSLPLLVAASIFPQSGGEISRVWLERAAALLRDDFPTEGQLKEADRALKIAAEFDNLSSDILYLQAKLLLVGPRTMRRGGSPISAAYGLLADSLDSNDRYPRLVRFEERAVLWASTALRLKDYRGLLNRYWQMPKGQRENALLLYAAARSALYLGFLDLAAELAVHGEALVDSNTDISRLGGRLSGEARPHFRALAIASGHEDSIRNLDSAWLYWGQKLERALVPWILNGTVNVDRTGTLANLLSEQVADVLLDRQDKAERTLPPEFQNDLVLLKKMREAHDEAVNAHLGNFSGLLEGDLNYDGYSEELLELINGEPVSRTIDMNQDGLVEWHILYDNSRPSSVLIDDGSLELLYQEDAYPALLFLRDVSEKTTVEISMNPGSFVWDIEKSAGFWGHPSLEGYSEDRLWYGARKVRVLGGEFPDGTGGEALSTLVDGYPVHAVEKRYLDDNPEKPLWIREIVYQDGIPLAGRRTYRMDPENPDRYLWELYERFENGVMVGIAWNPEMEGSLMYLRDWALEKYLETRIWDLDSDGWIDASWIALPGGEIMASELFVSEASSSDFIPWAVGYWSFWGN